ncbi:hypothetical protein CAP35_03880 [Chitinophagaceae bacterium IBVUCB1]|nr:hypothetical protein CAP35_03880 [Chitinophagaceae bacterium IBVUCB1]
MLYMNNWKKIKELLYFEDGSPRDICIKECNRELLHKWIGFVNNNFDLSFVYKEIISNKIDNKVVDTFLDEIDDTCYFITIHASHCKLYAYLFDDEEIEISFWPEDIQKVDDHKTILDCMLSFSNLLNKDVFLYKDNNHDNPLIVAENNTIRFIIHS